jgi:drug/metabolite transporter (DMT)-like permease
MSNWMRRALRDWFTPVAVGMILLIISGTIQNQTLSYLLALLGAIAMAIGSIRGAYQRAAEQKALADQDSDRKN